MLLNKHFDLCFLLFFQLNISFNDKTEVFEYPSFESVDTTDNVTDTKKTVDPEDVKQPTQSSSSSSSSSIFKTNSSVGSSGIFMTYPVIKVSVLG